jgi:CubicO group peptidase (beta-lactamase class C family)
MHPAFQVVQRYLEQHPIPGATAAIGRESRLEVYATGWLWHLTDAPPVTLETVWDLASLTKVFVTVPLLLKLHEQGKLDLKAPLRDSLPEIAGLPLETTTVWQLASHTAGLEALSKVRFWGMTRAQALNKALEEPRPETGIVYSDQGFIVLTYLVEKLYGSRIDGVAKRELFTPVGVELTYHPNVLRCACTELEPQTHTLLRGVVHDENTRALEGVSGHAGLFGSLPDVCAYVAALLEGRVLNDDSLELMRTEIARGDHDARAFGWVLRHDGWLGGQRAPQGALGHTGFTGTGVWFDLETRQFNVLLTNRVCPSREQPSEIAALRKAFNDAAW